MYRLSVVGVPWTPSWNGIVSRSAEEVEAEPVEEESDEADAFVVLDVFDAAAVAPVAELFAVGVEELFVVVLLLLDEPLSDEGVGATWITHFLISPAMGAKRLWASVLWSMTSRPAWVRRICISMAT